MALDLLVFAIGLVAVLAGAELVVRGAGHAAARARIAPVVVGLTVVAFGTSAPELAISLRAALSEEAANIALGNIVGSNIANVLLVLGVSAALAPLIVAQRLIRSHVPIMIAASLGTALLALDGHLGTADGLLLLAGLGLYLAFIALRDRESAEEIPAPGKASVPQIGGLLLLGLALLVGGANFLIDAAAAIAGALGISDLVIGLTVVAVGTSLPELATSAVAVLRGEREMAVGNVVGSNIFNLLAVLGCAALLTPAGVSVAPAALYFDLPVMIAVALACLPVFFTGYTIARWEGIVFLAYYAAYIAYLFLAATEHAALAPFSGVMLGFVIPLTLLTVAIGVARQVHAHHRPGGGRAGGPE